MSRNLCETRCDFCGWKPSLVERPREITAEDAGAYFDEFKGMIVANAECRQCGAKYLAWVDERPRKPWRHGNAIHVFDRHGWEDGDFFDLSFRSTFNDEPGDADLPTRPYGDDAGDTIAAALARAEKAEAALARRTKERDRARYIAKCLVDRLDFVSRDETIDAICAALADEPEEVTP